MEEEVPIGEEIVYLGALGTLSATSLAAGYLLWLHA
jgi:hypothetical protein